ncbi:MAG TPA: hypothetical protein VLJ80_15575 [Solirubrobacteraceae bacterium]|nr:hypothetical protein [Solirubrobacteraceae bacterium]
MAAHERPLAGVEAKLERAREHVERLEADALAFVERDPYRITVEYDVESDWHIAKAWIIEEPPLALSVVFGEFAYECVSALNHAIWQLAARKRGRSKVEAIKREVQFPVALTPKRFLKEPVIQHRHVSKAAIAVLNELQPYKRFGALVGSEHPLALLKAAADTDKHRVLAPRWGSVRLQDIHWVLNPSRSDPSRKTIGRFIVPRNQTLEDGTNVMGIRFDSANAQAKVDVEGDLAPDIALGAGEFMVSLRDIRYFSEYMSLCLKRLATLFP